MKSIGIVFVAGILFIVGIEIMGNRVDVAEEKQGPEEDDPEPEDYFTL